MRKSLFYGFLISLVLILILSGCTQQSSATVTSTSKQSASATASAKPITDIMIAGGRVGDPWYTQSQALANFINKNSDWLRATVVTTGGMTDNYVLAMKDPGRYIFTGDVANTLWMMKDASFGQQYNNYDQTRFISICCSIPCVYATYDPKIKTPQDMAGKKVFLSRKGSAGIIDDMSLMGLYGLQDKINVSYGGTGESVSALQDGLVDIGRVTIDLVYPNKFSKGQYIIQLETRKPIYYVNLDYDKIANLNKAEKFAPIPETVAPSALDPKTQPEALNIFDMTCFFAADARMNQDIVYEVTRIIYQTAGQWGSWGAQGGNITTDLVPSSPLPSSWVHPGAKKFYDEHGVQIKSLAEALKSK